MQKLMRFSVVCIVLAVATVAMAQFVKNVSPKEAYDYMQANEGKYTLIDVRTPEEYNEGHIRGAELLPIASPDFLVQVKKLPSNPVYVIYCRSGKRSKMARKIFSETGHSVMHIDGGIRAWKRAGLPVVK